MWLCFASDSSRPVLVGQTAASVQGLHSEGWKVAWKRDRLHLITSSLLSDLVAVSIEEKTWLISLSLRNSARAHSSEIQLNLKIWKGSCYYFTFAGQFGWPVERFKESKLPCRFVHLTKRMCIVITALSQSHFLQIFSPTVIFLFLILFIYPAGEIKILKSRQRATY